MKVKLSQLIRNTIFFITSVCSSHFFLSSCLILGLISFYILWSWVLSHCSWSSSWFISFIYRAQKRGLQGSNRATHDRKWAQIGFCSDSPAETCLKATGCLLHTAESIANTPSGKMPRLSNHNFKQTLVVNSLKSCSGLLCFPRVPTEQKQATHAALMSPTFAELLGSKHSGARLKGFSWSNFMWQLLTSQAT